MTKIYDLVAPDGKVVKSSTSFKELDRLVRTKKYQDYSIESWDLEKSM